MEATRLSELKPFQQAVPIKVRILKKWILSGSKLDKEEICFTFVDKYGDGIEARADIDMKEHLAKIVQPRSCYTITKYIIVINNNYLPALKHEASIVIGRKAYFEPVSADNIPYHFFQFASYDDLDARMAPPRQLTGNL